MTGKDVLIVEENQHLADALASSLKKASMETHFVDNVADAVAFLKTTGATVTLVSAGMSGGLAVALHDALEGASTKVVWMTTGAPRPQVVRLAKSKKAAGVVSKTQGPRRVLAALKELVGKRPVARKKAAPATKAPKEGKKSDKARVRSRPRARPLTPLHKQQMLKPEVVKAIANLKRREKPAAGAEGLQIPAAEREVAKTAQGCFDDGLEFFDVGDYDGALPCFIQACNEEPSNGLFIAYRARCKHLTSSAPPDPDGDLGDDLRMVIMLEPELVEGHLFLGHVYLDGHREDAASRCYRQVIKLDSGNKEARRGLSKIHNAVKD